MSRNEKLNEKIKDKRREQILKAALKVFIRKGFAATKMSAISNEANISYGLVYHYFQSKDMVYTELISIAFNGLYSSLKEIEKYNISPIDKLNKTAVNIFKSLNNKKTTGYYFVLMMQALTNDATPASALEIAKQIMNPIDILTNIIKSGQKKGEIIMKDSEQLAMTYFSSISGIAFFNVFGIMDKLPEPDIIMRIFKE